MSAVRAARRDIGVAERTVPAMLGAQAQRYGDRPLVQFEDNPSRSYREVREHAARWGGMLQAAGVGAGDRVAAMCANREELLFLILGCGWIGAIAVPLNTALRGAQLEHALNNSEPSFLMIDADRVSALHTAPGIAHRPTLWLVDDEPVDIPDGWSATDLPTLRAPVSAAAVRPSDTMVILYTSGTSGAAKGVLCPHAQFFWWAILTIEGLEIVEGDRLFTVLPLFHTNALHCFFQGLLSGSTYVFGSRFSASKYWEQVSRYDADVLYVVGAMAAILLERAPTPHDRAHHARVALGGGTPARMHAPFHERFNVSLVNGYASTETNKVLGLDVGDPRIDTMGTARDEFDVMVVDEYGAPCPDGTAGELVVRGREPNILASGYFKQPEKTVEAWQDLWFHTGDRVVRDPDGYFQFVDRMNDAIRRRGENVSSVAVEDVLNAHPHVVQAAVVPVPSELGDDEILAVITTDAADFDPIVLLRFCETRLAYFAIPRYVRVVDDFPLTANGKIRKQVLREIGVDDATWDREAAGFVLTR